MVFGDDWPGLFLRGDNAKSYQDALDAVLKVLEQGSVPPMHQVNILRELRDDLKLPFDRSEPGQVLRAYEDCTPDKRPEDEPTRKMKVP